MLFSASSALKIGGNSDRLDLSFQIFQSIVFFSAFRKLNDNFLFHSIDFRNPHVISYIERLVGSYERVELCLRSTCVERPLPINQ